MMGEFIIYYRGKIVGGIYDDRLLVKPVKSAISYMPTAPYELPYEGAKEMLLVATVALMDTYLEQNGYVNDINKDRLHHEIYMSDARKVAPEKWKTVIRHPIKKA